MRWHTKTLLRSAAAPPLSPLRSHCAPTSRKVCRAQTASLWNSTRHDSEPRCVTPLSSAKNRVTPAKSCFSLPCAVQDFGVLTLINPIDLEVVHHGLRERLCFICSRLQYKTLGGFRQGTGVAVILERKLDQCYWKQVSGQYEGRVDNKESDF